MKVTRRAFSVAYLAPEIPALSAPFVYEELLGLEERGIRVSAFSVRAPLVSAADQTDLARRVAVLYDNHHVTLLLSGIAGMFRFRARAGAALRYLFTDLQELGLFRLSTWKLFYQFLAAIKLARFLAQENPSHLHVHFAHTPAQIGMYASALTGIPFSIMAHANDIFERGQLLQRKAERAVKMLTISDYNRRYLNSCGIPDSSLGIVRCGIAGIASYGGVPERKPAAFRIATLGRFVEKKGFDVLIRAMALLVGRHPELELTLSIGGDGLLRRELEILARELGVAHVLKLEGNVPHHAVPGWMRRHDAFALACKKDRNGDMDGIPVVLIEAMAQGVPVVSTRLSGIPELVVHERTGLLAAPGDHVDFADQIDRIIRDPALAARVAIAGRKHVAEEFSRVRNLDRLLAYFKASSPQHT